MFQKSNSRLRIESMVYLKTICLGFFISVLLANCKGKDKSDKVEGSGTENIKISYELSIDSLKAVQDDTSKVNWLDGHGWDTVAVNADPADGGKIFEELEKVRFYVIGALAEYNATHRARDTNVPYRVENFLVGRKNSSPLQYTIVAFLNPPATVPPHHEHEEDGEGAPGGHVIPPPPPPPGGRD